MLTNKQKVSKAVEILRPSNSFVHLPFDQKRKIYRLISMLIKMRVV